MVSRIFWQSQNEKSISTDVTDELVTRGNGEVLRSVTANDGARFSNFGFLHAIRRSTDDSILAESLGVRKDIPRAMFQQLIAKASADVKCKADARASGPVWAGSIVRP
ncbi:MAG: DUF2336 domain-containing protein [Bradyrhizobium sp.]